MQSVLSSIVRVMEVLLQFVRVVKICREIVKEVVKYIEIYFFIIQCMVVSEEEKTVKGPTSAKGPTSGIKSVVFSIKQHSCSTLHQY